MSEFRKWSKDFRFYWINLFLRWDQSKKRIHRRCIPQLTGLLNPLMDDSRHLSHQKEALSMSLKHTQAKSEYKGSHYLYGLHAVRAALSNPRRKLLRLMVSEEKLLEDLGVGPLAQKVPTELVDKSALNKFVGPGAVHQGVCLQTVPLEQPDLEDLLASQKTFQRLAILDQVTDPHNVGAILRSAAAFAIDGLLMTKNHAPSQSGTLAKAASGALEHVPLVSVTNLARALETLKEEGFWCIGLDGQGEDACATLKTYKKLALILGAEGDGMRRLTRAHCDLVVKISTQNDFCSLNVSNAAAIAFFCAKATDF